MLYCLKTQQMFTAGNESAEILELLPIPGCTNVTLGFTVMYIC